MSVQTLLLFYLSEDFPQNLYIVKDYTICSNTDQHALKLSGILQIMKTNCKCFTVLFVLPGAET